jgi:hypothetical protein
MCSATLGSLFGVLIVYFGGPRENLQKVLKKEGFWNYVPGKGTVKGGNVEL